MPMGREIVFISHWFGHTPHFAECVLPFFLDRGYRIYNLTDKPGEAEAFFTESFGERAGEISNLQIDVLDPLKPSRGKDTHYRRVEAHWRGVGSSLRRLFGELGRKVGIFHTWVDLYSHEYLERPVIEEAMPAPWCGLYVHPAELRIYKTWKRRLLENARDFFKQGRIFPCRLRAFDVPMARKVYFWDEKIPALIANRFQYFKNAGVFPEALKNKIDEPRKTPSEIEDFAVRNPLTVSLVGFLSKRKGLLKILKIAKQGSTRWGFLVGGEMDWDSFSDEENSEIRSILENPLPKLLVINRHLADFELQKIIESCQCVYVAYEDFFHSSNIQLLAARFKKPMIAGPQHLIAERTKRFQMGWCLPELSQEAVVELLNIIDEKEIERVRCEARFQEFCVEHSPERLRVVLGEICDLLG